MLSLRCKASDRGRRSGEPGVDERDAETLEILGIACRESKVVGDRGGRDQAVHREHIPGKPVSQRNALSPLVHESKAAAERLYHIASLDERRAGCEGRRVCGAWV